MLVTQQVSLDFRQFSKLIHTDLRIHLDLIFNFEQGLPDPRMPCIAYTQHSHVKLFCEGRESCAFVAHNEKGQFFHQGL